MKKAAISLALLLACAAAATAGEEQREPRSEVEYYRQLAEKQLAELRAVPEPEPAPEYAYYASAPENLFSVMPGYFHSRDGEDGSRANGAGARVLYSRALSECFSFSLLYEYAFMEINGGASGVRDDRRWHAHTAGVQGGFALGAFGRLVPSLAHSFQQSSGDSAWGDDADSTSLMAWWEKDFAVGCGWLLTPYAGWRSLHADRDGARFAEGARDWTHLAAGGMKLGYQGGCLGVNLRAGLSHRLGPDDEGTRFAYGSRALANGVVRYSHRANRDKTVGFVGAGITYAVGASVSVGIDYDGFFGADTSAHAGTLSLGFSF